ncbi:MAG: DoxX family protein [SAR86 cluster bacterium]|uniref:DoxX family protein n=1 Tax=SAR86 cluster bacterium TaxID=2030880 RepID=A0A2A5B6Q2_9GAMM|nr:MAG: DoxX family protein [SAR86 cluster bacterium]
MIGRINSLFEGVADKSKDWTWTLFRILSSAMFMTHGFAKLFGENPQPFTGGGITTVNIGDLVSWPMPMEINALFVTGVIEFFGGFLILIGLWTHLVALMAVFIMIMAYLTAHLAWFPTLNRGELAAMYIAAYMVIFAFGAGPFSMDALLAERRQEKRKNRMRANS